MKALAVLCALALLGCSTTYKLSDGTEMDAKEYRLKMRVDGIKSVVNDLSSCAGAEDSQGISEGGEIACEVRKAMLPFMLPELIRAVAPRDRDWVDVADIILTHTERLLGIYVGYRGSKRQGDRSIKVTQSMSAGRDLILTASSSGSSGAPFSQEDGGFTGGGDRRSTDVMTVFSPHDDASSLGMGRDLITNRASGGVVTDEKGTFAKDCGNGSAPCVDDADEVRDNGFRVIGGP